MRLRDQRSVNVGARARDVIAAALDRERPADLDAVVRVLREALGDPHGRGEIRARGPAPTSEDTENRDTRYAASRLHRERDSPSPVPTGTWPETRSPWGPAP